MTRERTREGNGTELMECICTMGFFVFYSILLIQVVCLCLHQCLSHTIAHVIQFRSSQSRRKQCAMQRSIGGGLYPTSREERRTFPGTRERETVNRRR